jgi:tetratricopeptide (TPR) repeat protein
LGTIQYTREKYADSEGYFRKSLEAFPDQPDPLAVLRLALSLDKQEKYPEALKYANQAVQLTEKNEGTTLATLSRNERDRLVQLTGGTPAKPPASAQTPAPKN